MKAISSIFISLLILTGCHTFGIHKVGGVGSGVNQNCANRSVSNECETANLANVVLTSEVEIALKKLGIPDISFIAVVSKDGEITFAKSAATEVKRFQLPSTFTIESIQSYSLIKFKGSTCKSWIAGHVEGGAWISGYCDD
ncbi:MAG: hypothetical protein IPI97_05000 [Nitrosomonas sp.]|nr:hypothetical protein [Nitrosomonas sp.]MBK7364366.1 hypothetical protein [Nitrosomonas sp.]